LNSSKTFGFFNLPRHVLRLMHALHDAQKSLVAVGVLFCVDIPAELFRCQTFSTKGAMVATIDDTVALCNDFSSVVPCWF